MNRQRQCSNPMTLPLWLPQHGRPFKVEVLCSASICGSFRINWIFPMRIPLPQTQLGRGNKVIAHNFDPRALQVQDSRQESARNISNKLGRKAHCFWYFCIFYKEGKRRFHYIIHRLVKLQPPLHEEFLALLYALKPISSIHCTNEALPSHYNRKCDCR